MTIMYALGWTQHTHGAQNIRTAAMIQLLCGNIGIPGGGVNALRGHSNVQGITDVGTLTAAIPGYLALPTEQEPTLESHLGKRTFKPLTPNQTSYWQNYRKFYVSFLKTQFGASATPENEFGYNCLPKLDGIYDCIKMFDLMHQGKTNGLLCQGFNPADGDSQHKQEPASAVEAEVHGQHGSDRDRLGPVLGKPWRVQQCRPRQDSDRSVHASGDVVCGRGRQRHKLQPCHSMEVEGC